MGKAKFFSVVGLIVGILSLALVFIGDGVAENVYPNPPPPPLLTRNDMSPINEGEIKGAVVDFAGEVVASSVRKVADATVRTGKRTARKAWGTVKGWMGGRSGKMGEAEAEEKPDTPSPKPKDERRKPFSDDKPLDEEAMKTPAEKTIEVQSDTAPTDMLSWRDVKVNVFNPGSPEQKSLKGIFSTVTLVGGLLGLVLAMTGWIRREDQRVCICAAVMSVLAMAWVYLIGAIAIAIVAVILGPIISS